MQPLLLREAQHDIAVSPPSAVIFDTDGLLFDTEALWQEALLSAAAEGGHEISDGVFNKSIGVRRSQCRALFLSHFGEDFLFDDFHANWVRHFWLIAENKLTLKPGAPELLEILDQFRRPRVQSPPRHLGRPSSVT
jgi:beta-phosphoglucomutase-like phosphatase (HAD superfamily)